MRVRLLTTVYAILMMVPLSVQAHLLHKQEATLRLEGEKGYLAVAVPAAAFSGVDDDADGRLAPQEIAAHQDNITRQFKSRFRITSPEGKGTLIFTWVTNPADTASPTHDHDGSTGYVIILAGAEFDVPPTRVTIETDLFGDAPDENALTLRARRGNKVERAVLSGTAPSHEFFAGH